MLFVLAGLASLAHAEDRKLWNDGWRFGLGHATDRTKDYGYEAIFSKAGGSGGASDLGFDDSELRPVTLPHDWAIELPFVKSDWGSMNSHGYHPLGRDFPDTSVGWYRKSFSAPKEWEGKHVLVHFDGVFRDSKIFVNGNLVGSHWSGYSGFTVDISDTLNYGSKNALSVRVDASSSEGWFYEGAGIYRNVWLEVQEPVHFDPGSFIVRATPKSGGKWSVFMSADVVNDSKIDAHMGAGLVYSGNYGDGSAPENFTLPAGQRRTVTHTSVVDNPHLWSVDDPHLYQARFNLWENGGTQSSGQKVVRYGFRTFRFDKDKGFFLNGKPLKIQGMCNHQDHAGVGAAVPDDLNYWRVAQLKKIGVNAYRTSHNPPTESVLDACDELGMLVMDENRLLSSSPDQMEQWDWQVRRDRNHASVFLWSIANEEWTHASEPARRQAVALKNLVNKLDPTRLTTYACNEPGLATGVNSVIDIRGFNYGSHEALDDFRKKHPERELMGSETASTVSTRGIYANDKVKGYVSAYDLNYPGWASTAEYWWSYYGSHDYMSGGFCWTGFDYRGEPTPYGWPCISSHFGVLDTCGNPKDVAYYYKAWWTHEPVVHMLPHWNWAGKEGQPIDVWVFSNQFSVELFLNGKSLGSKKVPELGHLEWKVPYAAGELKAVAKSPSGRKIEEVISTTGDPAQVKLTAEPAKPGSDVQVVTVSSVDSLGRPVPTAMNTIKFALDGGEILGVGNGDPSSHEPDVYVPGVSHLSFGAWQVHPMQGVPQGTALPALPTEGWKDGRLGMGTIPQNSTLIYRTQLTIPSGIPATTMRVSHLDDLGWVYVNGKLVQVTDQWDGSYSIDLSKAAHPGSNEIIVIVHNNGGEGGFGAISASYPTPADGWQRKLFNGLAQVIVRSRGGRLTATSDGLKSATVSLSK